MRQTARGSLSPARCSVGMRHTLLIAGALVILLTFSRFSCVLTPPKIVSLKLRDSGDFTHHTSSSSISASFCSRSTKSTRAAAWDWRQEVGLPSGKGPISFKELILGLVPPEKRTNMSINVGAQNGIEHDPVYSLLKDLGYGTVAFEGNPTFLPVLRKNMAAVNTSNNVHVIEGYASSSSVVDYLHRHKVHSNVDALKIDIDSFDLSIAKAILQAGYRPKFLMMEINPDIIPPLQWYLEEDPAFKFSMESTKNGVYGVSGDAVFHVMAQHGYRLLELELVDPAATCKRCEHNMWFMHNDVLEGKDSWPSPPSYDEYVTIFWTRQPVCLHIPEEFCPVAHVKKVFPSLPADVASMMLLTPHQSAVAYKLLGYLASGMASACPNCTMHFQLSQVPPCSGEVLD